MKVLVTGGAGYVGSHACKALARRGFEPITLDNFVRGNRWAVQWGPVEEGDIIDIARVIALLQRYRPVAVMHFAAFAYVGESISDPLLYYQNNVVGTVSLLRAIAAFGNVPFIFSSTCATYGIPQQIPISETHPQLPVNPYGFSKLVVERSLSDLDRVLGMRSVALRYFNAAGADPEGAIGEAHEPEPHLIPRALAAARDGTPIAIYGDDYKTPDGTCIRDFVHVCDIATAHVLALEYLLGGGSSCALNLANTRGHSVLEVVKAAERVTGRPIAIEKAPRRMGDPPVLVGAAVAARDVLNWTPNRSDLDTQICDAWAWMQKAPARSGIR